MAIDASDSQGQNLTITALGNGSYLINGNGIPGYTYRVQFFGHDQPSNGRISPAPASRQHHPIHRHSRWRNDLLPHGVSLTVLLHFGNCSPSFSL